MGLVVKVVSGGKPGADIGALDFAIAHELLHGGWCPRGRKAEDGPIDPRYQLTELQSSGYVQRTEWNVRDEQAKEWLEKAFKTGNARKMKLMALDDPDLESLWKDISRV